MAKCNVCGLRIRSPIEAHNSSPHHLRRDPHVTGSKLSRITKKREAHGKPTNIGDPSSKKKD